MRPTNVREGKLSHDFSDLHRAGRIQHTRDAWWSEAKPWKPVQNNPRAGRWLKQRAAKLRRQGALEEIREFLRD